MLKTTLETLLSLQSGNGGWMVASGVGFISEAFSCLGFPYFLVLCLVPKPLSGIPCERCAREMSFSR